MNLHCSKKSYTDMKSCVLFIIYLNMCVVITVQSGCRGRSNCVMLRNCQPFMALIDSLEKPLKHSVVEFLREQECGFTNGYPMVCCSALPKNLRVLKNSATGLKDSRKNGILVELLDAEQESTKDIAVNNRLPINDEVDRINHVNSFKKTLGRPTTQKPKNQRSTTRKSTTTRSTTEKFITSTRKKISKVDFDKKSEAINFAFGSSGMFDDFEMFDLFRKKRIAVESDYDEDLDIEIR